MRQLVFGCNGPVGLTLMERLAESGHEVIGVCRSGRADVPSGIRVEAADVRDRDRAAVLARGAEVIHCTVGIDYRVWAEQWMPIVDGLLHATKSSGARLVFADNLYCYGPRSEPLREDMALTHHGRKPALRARMAERLFEAHERGVAKVVMVRASDFFGPRTRNALLGERVFDAALRGKAAQVIGRPDLPHAYSYVPDFARALELVSADEGAFGRAWHLPNPPTRSTRDILGQIYTLAGQPLKVQVLPAPMLTALGWFFSIMRELKEMEYQWTRPFEVDASAFATRYQFEATAWEPALRATLEWFAARRATEQGAETPVRTRRRS